MAVLSYLITSARFLPLFPDFYHGGDIFNEAVLQTERSQQSTAVSSAMCKNLLADQKNSFSICTQTEGMPGTDARLYMLNDVLCKLRLNSLLQLLQLSRE